MKNAKVFQAGNSQAVRLPKEIKVQTRELLIFEQGGDIILRPVEKKLRRALEILKKLPRTFMTERNDAPPQGRDGL